jgi:P2X purinoceptor 4
MGLWQTLKTYLSPNFIFSYSTVKIVQIQDWRVGFMHRFIQILIFCYVVGYVIIYNENYLIKERSVGIAATKVAGNSFGINTKGEEKFASSSDLTYPASEPGALFIATRFSTTRNQKVDWCSHPIVKPCEINEDCLDRNLNTTQRYKCENKSCQFLQWCPEENEDLQPNNATETTTWNDVKDFTIWIKSSINFNQLKPGVIFSTIHQSVPIPRSVDPIRGNLFTLNQLLTWVNNVNTTYDKIKARGAILRVQIQWKCNLDKWDNNEACSINYESERMDDSRINDGINFRVSNLLGDTRDITKMYGVRIFFESVGVGYRFSLITIILQVSSGLAMMVVATFICDIAIQYLFPQKDKYTKAKTKIVKNYTSYGGEEISSDEDSILEETNVKIGEEIKLL